MKIYTQKRLAPAEIVAELLDGPGAVVLRGLFTPAEVAEARAVVMRESEGSSPKVTHFQGAAEQEGRIDLQRRVWNLLAKGEVFSRMAAHPALMAVMRAFLGTEFIMGSIAANRILPGGTALSALLHVARTVTRRAERSAWVAVKAYPDTVSPLPARYLNRLSDLLFILCRVANPGGDVLWQPGGGKAEGPQKKLKQK